MTLQLDPRTEERLAARAADSGMTVSEYVEQILQAYEALGEDMDSYVLAGESSGPSIPMTSEYWESKRALIRQRFTKS
jgi:hypothetical protein